MSPVDEIFADHLGNGTQSLQAVGSFPHPDVHDVTFFFLRIKYCILRVQHVTAGFVRFIFYHRSSSVHLPVDAVGRIIGKQSLGLPHSGDCFVSLGCFAFRIGVVKRNKVVPLADTSMDLETVIQNEVVKKKNTIC